MLKKMGPERNFEFRRRLNEVHIPRRVNKALEAGPDETEITGDWRIVVPADASDFVYRAAQDLQDYFARSMELALLLKKDDAARPPARSIVYRPASAAAPRKARSYRLTVTPDRVEIDASDERGVAQGGYYLEDLMNLRSAPFLKREVLTRSPVFSPRMTHSGWAIDQFPDAHLNAIAHAGMDTILLFIESGTDQTRSGYVDTEDLALRAAGYGIDLYFYPLLPCEKHPSDPGAEEYYEQLYGSLIRKCPHAGGIVFVGESCSFPTRDPHTCGRAWWEPVKDPDDRRPLNGFYPSEDYPEWLEMVKKVTRKYNPGLDIVFWSYNWGWAPDEARLALIRRLPPDITLEATFEMFEPVRHPAGEIGADSDLSIPVADYSTVLAGPGHYFRTEAEEAHRLGLKLYAMSNTGGDTWDIGVIGYEPIPYRWKMRVDALLEAHREWNLTGLMESHHYGWVPSFVSELIKEAYWTGGMDFEFHIRAIAERDFGPGMSEALNAWRLWSDAFAFYTPASADQYGPFRVGPSYPLLFPGETAEPPLPFTRFGGWIVNFTYPVPDPGETRKQLLSLRRMEILMEEGCRCMRRLPEELPRPEEAGRIAALGEFILCTVRTAIHTKEWYLACLELREKPAETLAALEKIGRAELENAHSAIPFAEIDSRIGFEPRSNYMGDREHIEWKLAHLQNTLESVIPQYKHSLQSNKEK